MQVYRRFGFARVSERFVQNGLQLAAFGRTFDGFHREPVGLHREQQAAAHDPALEAHRARAAHSVLAADVRAGEAEILAQEVDEIAPYRDSA